VPGLVSINPKLGILCLNSFKMGITKIRPEKNKLDESTADAKDSETRKQYQMLAASCERELLRIKNESAVRLGDSIINESDACDLVSDVLKKLKAQYLKLA